jgi:hypothetical protein
MTSLHMSDDVKNMSVADQVWIGADPGGKGNFGLVILGFNGSVSTYCVDCTDEAIQIVVQRVNSTPAGLGVDAPLWWSSARSSYRQADQWLRTKYGLPGGQVQAALMFRKKSWATDRPDTRKTIRLPSGEMVTPRSNVRNEKALLSKVVKGMSKRTTGMLVDGDFGEKFSNRTPRQRLLQLPQEQTPQSKRFSRAACDGAAVKKRHPFVSCPPQSIQVRRTNQPHSANVFAVPLPSTGELHGPVPPGIIGFTAVIGAGS